MNPRSLSAQHWAADGCKVKFTAAWGIQSLHNSGNMTTMLVTMLPSKFHFLSPGKDTSSSPRTGPGGCWQEDPQRLPAPEPPEAWESNRVLRLAGLTPPRSPQRVWFISQGSSLSRIPQESWQIQTEILSKRRQRDQRLTCRREEENLSVPGGLFCCCSPFSIPTVGKEG